MRFAVTAKYNRFCSDFERCTEFAIIDVKDNAVVTELYWTSPPHERGLFPEWFYYEMKVNAVITGNMDQQLQQGLAEKGILVVTGATDESPRKLVENYLNRTPVKGACSCAC